MLTDFSAIAGTPTAIQSNTHTITFSNIFGRVFTQIQIAVVVELLLFAGCCALEIDGLPCVSAQAAPVAPAFSYSPNPLIVETDYAMTVRRTTFLWGPRDSAGLCFAGRTCYLRRLALPRSRPARTR